MAVPGVGWKKVFKGLKLSVQPSRNEGNKAPTLRYNGSQRGRYFILMYLCHAIKLRYSE